MQRKTAFITGASRGIGRAIALTLAKEGYHLFLNCNHSISELESLAKEITALPGGSCQLLCGDIGNPDVVRNIFRQIYTSCDALDVLINNAGRAHIGLLTDMSDEEWNCLIQTNLSSVFYCCREAIPPMVARKSGCIINISSMWGTYGASCEVAYSATKSGINGLTKALAKELAPSQIPVNAIACGVIDTTMNGQLDATERESLENEIPAGRFGTPQEVADCILQLIKSPAYLTGQIIGFDGGF